MCWKRIFRIWQVSTQRSRLYPSQIWCLFHSRTDAGLRVKRLKELSGSAELVLVAGPEEDWFASGIWGMTTLWHGEGDRDRLWAAELLCLFEHLR